MKKLFMTMALAVMTNLLVYSQTPEWENPPKPSETVIANISQTIDRGEYASYSRVATYRKPDFGLIESIVSKDIMIVMQLWYMTLKQSFMTMFRKFLSKHYLAFEVVQKLPLML